MDQFDILLSRVSGTVQLGNVRAVEPRHKSVMADHCMLRSERSLRQYKLQPENYITTTGRISLNLGVDDDGLCRPLQDPRSG